MSSPFQGTIVAVALALCSFGFQRQAARPDIVSGELAAAGAGDMSIGRFVNGIFLAVPFGRKVDLINLSPSFFFEISQFSQDGKRLVGYGGGRFTVLGEGFEVIWERSIAPKNIAGL